MINKQHIKDYSIDDLMRMVLDGVVPGHCVHCGHYVKRVEPDAMYTMHCPHCGTERRVGSVLRLKGLI